MAAIAAMAAAACVVVVALAYALYALALTWLTPAGAAAVVAGVAALLIVILALVVLRKASPQSLKRVADAEPQSLTTRLIELARERPLVAAAGAAAVAVVVARNPAVLTALISGAFASRAASKATPPKKR